MRDREKGKERTRKQGWQEVRRNAGARVELREKKRAVAGGLHSDVTWRLWDSLFTGRKLNDAMSAAVRRALGSRYRT